MVPDGITQLAVHHGELRQGRPLSAARRVHDTSHSRRGPASTSDRTPTLEINGRATKVGRDIRIAAMASYDSCNAILIAGTRLVGANVAASAASVVLLIDKIAVLVAVKKSTSNRHNVRRRCRIGTHAKSPIASGCKVD